jgi:TRAP-type mannitol/chloroaromatic compound transport system permease small subunit
MQRLIGFADRLSILTGKASAWLFGLLMVVVCVEVAKRYLLNMPTAWIFDATTMLYGAGFMLCGAYGLAQNAHVRGDFLYGSMPPRRQAAFDLVLYFVFFLPGVLGLIFAGWDFAAISWKIGEHSNITAEGPPVYQFKTVIPVAGALVLIQGVAEILRCIICLKTGAWPERPRDAEEIDVVEEQLAASAYVDEDAKRDAIAHVHEIDEAAHQRNAGPKP